MRTCRFGIIGLLLTALAATSCGVTEQEAPPLAGPSELALSLSVQAQPDTILQDTSASTVTIQARGPNSQPARGVSLRIDVAVDNIITDFGTLSTKTAVTGDDGIARVTYTSPPRPPLSIGFGEIVTLVVTPIGGDYRGATSRQVDIRVMPPGVILPPGSAPVPAFTFSPRQPQVFTTILFDASNTADDGVRCGSRCSYSWTFGDGSSGSGRTVEHEYRAAGTFVVTLTVVDDRGQSTSLSENLTVAAGTLPTPIFTFSPTQPRTSRDIFYTAEASRAGNGRRIISYDWNFGSGRVGTGATIAKRYDTPGTYVVTLTVVDDAFQQATISQPVTVVP